MCWASWRSHHLCLSDHFFNSLFHILQWCTIILCHYPKLLSVGIQLWCGKTCFVHQKWIAVWNDLCYHIPSFSATAQLLISSIICLAVAAYFICYPYYNMSY
jgi:hypothetical protein